MASMRRCQKIPSCPTEPMPAGSKMHLLLAKAEPICSGGSINWHNTFKKGKEAAQDQLKLERGVGICGRKKSADTKGSEEGQGCGAPDVGAEISLQPVRKDLMRQVVLLQPKVEHRSSCS